MQACMHKLHCLLTTQVKVIIASLWLGRCCTFVTIAILIAQTHFTCSPKNARLMRLKLKKGEKALQPINCNYGQLHAQRVTS